MPNQNTYKSGRGTPPRITETTASTYPNRRGYVPPEFPPTAKPIRYVEIPVSLLTDSSLSHEARLVWCLLRAALADDVDVAPVRLSNLASMLGRSEQTVRGWVRQLRGHNLVSVRRRPCGINFRFEWQLLRPDDGGQGHQVVGKFRFTSEDSFAAEAAG